ncbi:MAG: mannose-1-phosphate guanylyltransferase [Acidobacteria bacterium]|nr:mannose-1-phosphate guanylyltransferase [Acidobacteriota bacterium]
MSQLDRAVLILAGGAGTRLWPLSTDANPKQFLPIFGGRSLLEHAFDRLANIADPSRIFVSTNDAYRESVIRLLPSLPPEHVLVEPARRNTAPAIAACCAEIERRLGDVVVGIFPSDHAIANVSEFTHVVSAAYDFASGSDHLVTIGLEPTEPNTGFGYLELGEPIASPVHRLLRFVEKPTRERAEEFLATGRYLWNGGMFVWRLGAFFEALSAAAPEIASLAREFAAAPSRDEAATVFSRMPSISIDYALMEKAPRVATVRGEFGWSDVGSWAAVAQVIGDATPKRTVVDSSSNVFVLTETERTVAVVGASDLFIIDSPNGLLVLGRESGERLSAVVKAMDAKP